MMDDINEIFRLKVRFETLIYPCEAAWRGRRKVEAVELSGRGISFYCEQQLVQGERIEVVIPMMQQPLVLQAQVLNVFQEAGRLLYTVEFIELCREEEKLLNETVFSIQLKQHRRNKMKRKGEQP
ncbi:MAG: PilZ domain-containing protein [Oscillospiraceae bacterium]|nr:PilZ domain-containing protein [Oscillospiraceae bacterium]